MDKTLSQTNRMEVACSSPSKLKSIAVQQDIPKDAGLVVCVLWVTNSCLIWIKCTLKCRKFMCDTAKQPESLCRTSEANIHLLPFQKLLNPQTNKTPTPYQRSFLFVGKKIFQKDIHNQNAENSWPQSLQLQPLHLKLRHHWGRGGNLNSFKSQGTRRSDNIVSYRYDMELHT